MLNKTAILLFSRLPHEEILCKKLTLNADNNLAIWERLYRKTVLKATKTSLPIIFCSSTTQNGKTFAEKITNALIDSFKIGYENIILIGSDAPNLTTEHINFANSELNNGKQFVSGKDMRGGIYLLALHKNAFDATSFFNFNWQTNNLFKELITYASGFNYSILKEVLLDVNNTADALKTSLLFNINKALKFLLLKIKGFNNNAQQKIQTSLIFFVPLFDNILRGPPTLIFA